MVTYLNIFQPYRRAQTIFLACLLGLIAALPFDEGGNGYLIQAIIQTALLGCAVIWALDALRRQACTVVVGWLDLCVVGFLGWAAFSFAFSAYQYATLLAMIKLVSYAAVFFLCRMLFPLGRLSNLILLAIVSSSVVQALLAWGLWLFGKTPVLRAAFLNPNELACFLVLGCVIGVSWLLFAADEQPANSRRGRQLLMATSVGLLFITILAIKSRGGAVSLIGATGLLLALKSKRLLLGFLLLCSVTFVLPLPGGSLLTRFQKRDDAFAYERFDIWRSSLEIIADYPVRGVGLGMYAYYSKQYNFPLNFYVARYSKIAEDAHNDLLHMTAESGGGGLLLALGAVGLLARSIWPGMRHRPRAWPVVAAAAGIGSVLLHGLFSVMLNSPAIAILTTLCAVILVDAARRYQTFPRTWRTSWWSYALVSGGAVYLLIPFIVYPLLGHVHFLKYHELLKQKKYQPAVAHIQAASYFAPMQAYYYYELGLLYQRAFRNHPDLETFYQAYRLFNEALHYHPRDERVHESLAILHKDLFYRVLRTPPTARNALQEYQQAFAYQPSNPFLLISMATLHADLDEFEQAIGLLQHAITLEPNFVGGHQLLGKMLAHLGRPQEAEAAFARAAAILQQYQEQSYDAVYIQNLLHPLESKAK